MDRLGYILLTVGIIGILITLFFVTFVAYRKAPVPKGCEKLPSVENCAKCSLGEGCSVNIYAKKEGPKK